MAMAGRVTARWDTMTMTMVTGDDDDDDDNDGDGAAGGEVDDDGDDDDYGDGRRQRRYGSTRRQFGQKFQPERS